MALLKNGYDKLFNKKTRSEKVSSNPPQELKDRKTITREQEDKERYFSILKRGGFWLS
tara:strand:- start:140 stop:313 length:174 start_codon:yes stop_codon:yes gene_type:complete